MNEMPYDPRLRQCARIFASLLLAISAVLATCDRGFAISACDPIDNEIELTPVPPNTSRTMRRHLALAAEPKSQVDVVLVGDSLVEVWPEESIRSFASTYANLGMSGDKVSNIIWRMKHSDWSGYRPKYAVLLLGTNDLNGNQDSCSIALGLETVIKLMKRIWPETKIITINILPRNGNFNVPPRAQNFRATDQLRIEVNDIINAKMASESRVITLNFDASLICEQPSDCSKLYVDLVHLRKAGYGMLATSIKQIISGE